MNDKFDVFMIGMMVGVTIAFIALVFTGACN